MANSAKIMQLIKILFSGQMEISFIIYGLSDLTFELTCQSGGTTKGKSIGSPHTLQCESLVIPQIRVS